ncbi:TadE/TadG family type IV pilus assembly protein [Hyphomicrobium sp.]|uniref:TadE/TadG family type IV pilus assembly protein n=1 Tax=Hyphomicrobium sp. TaxID=82 RepID=UPI002E2F76EA|nr:TadE/TadG family type IV pilus assembly protein [Hyphomicrobium sp.]HEX2842482.1 TadE/TadG family type IV pilus assembly protein [Hyphomicrobium sp.]
MPGPRTMMRPAQTVRSLRTFWSDVRGVVAVEFGFIAPVLMVLLLGSADLARAIAANRKFELVTSMVSDLVAREEKLTGDDVRKIYDIARLAMSPYGTTDLKVAIIPVASNPTDANKTAVYAATTNRPSFPAAGGELAKCQAYPLSAGLIAANESVIVVESSYEFADLFLLPKMTFEAKSITRPRKSACVDFDGIGKPCGTCFS